MHASIRATDLVTAGTVGITVSNPEPRAGQSSTLPFMVNPSDEPLLWSIFMPATAKP